MNNVVPMFPRHVPRRDRDAFPFSPIDAGTLEAAQRAWLLEEIGDPVKGWSSSTLINTLLESDDPDVRFACITELEARR